MALKEGDRRILRECALDETLPCSGRMWKDCEMVAVAWRRHREGDFAKKIGKRQRMGLTSALKNCSI